MKIIRRIDRTLIHIFRNTNLLFARISLFVVFFWFGILKVIGASPANQMVIELLDKTFSFMEPSLFLVLFGLFEVIIGITFLMPRIERFAIALLSIHLLTTILPLFLLTHLTWSDMFIPTMEGQYIIKNILIVAVAISIASHLRPLGSETRSL